MSVEHTAHNLIYHGRKATEEGNYVYALKMYFDYCDLTDPDKYDKTVEYEIINILNGLDVFLQDTSTIEDLLKCYIKAVNIFPQSAPLLNILGGYLFRVGEVDIGKKYIEKSLSLNCQYLPAEKNLLYIKWGQISRWHFRMLNDVKRNLNYKHAISKACDEGFDKVVDIGSGCGLLTLYAATSNNKPHITAFEENKTLFEISKNILADEKIENVDCIDTLSYLIPSFEYKANLLITEIFDVCIFGEGILKSLVHAYDELLSKDNFRVIPHKAILYVTGIESDEIYSKTHGTNRLSVHGLDQNLCLIAMNEEPYEAEELSQRSHRYVTETLAFLKVDFNDPEFIKYLNKNFWHKIIKLKALASGTIHALAVWFDLYTDETTYITTNPKGGENRALCWEQGIFHIDHAFKVKKGEEVDFIAKIVEGALSFDPAIIRVKCLDCYFIPQEFINILNDKKFVKSVTKLTETIRESSGVVIDYNIFPLFGLLMAKKGFQVIYVYREHSCLPYIEYLTKRNKIDDSSFLMLEYYLHARYVSKLRKVDYVFLEPLDTDGGFKVWPLPVVGRLFSKWNTVVFPAFVNIKFCLINSSHIEVSNKVEDCNVEPFKIGQYINKYTGYEHPSLENFEHDVLSDDFEWNIKQQQKTDATFRIKATKSGMLNGILTWFAINYREGLECNTKHGTHYKKTCFLVNPPKQVNKGDVINIRAISQEIFLKMFVDDIDAQGTSS